MSLKKCINLSFLHSENTKGKVMTLTEQQLSRIGVLVEETGLAAIQVANTVGLLQEGATVPFIARYRKELDPRTGRGSNPPDRGPAHLPFRAGRAESHCAQNHQRAG